MCSVVAAGKTISHGYLHVGIQWSADEHIYVEFLDS
jgi:hypothetical protein